MLLEKSFGSTHFMSSQPHEGYQWKLRSCGEKGSLAIVPMSRIDDALLNKRGSAYERSRLLKLSTYEILISNTGRIVSQSDQAPELLSSIVLTC